MVIISEPDPVARAVAADWGSLPAEYGHVDGAPIRRLAPGVLVLRRPGRHVHDELLDSRLPAAVRAERPTLVFPSIHRSGTNVPSLTVHPLGNPGSEARLGGRPRTLVPTDPGRMASALRLLQEGGPSVGLSATYEATHHGPELESPAFFMEIGYGELAEPPPEAVRLLRETIPRIEGVPGDRVAMGAGGGHYAPHFTDLARTRRWAFGHLLSRHSLEEIDRPTALDAYSKTPGAEGILFARAQDTLHPPLQGVGPRLRDQDAPERRAGDGGGRATSAARSASGT